MSLHVLLDIEALGKQPGSAIIEIGAVAFDLATGKIGEHFHRHIIPDPNGSADVDTLAWHEKRRSWPRRATLVDLHEHTTVLHDFTTWLEQLGDVQDFWAWGSTYDFPILGAAYVAAGFTPPWQYYQCCCARSVWRLAFGKTKATEKPHSACEDARIAVLDLIRATQALRQSAAA